ncbi:Fic family protein [Streptomonospora wellingtoniae]|uniref:Oxidoreductase n=1 Tax=Streptomonospora wellingtoniae TaxID=3075544 RepID=A0ABU2KXQ1_9ACTN|nr:oxidoreductase [Streptomonospora sp. DSM 45055]MDT0304038.1 oxidoreductase [Streptomonospora sp. DSM 45055]
MSSVPDEPLQPVADLPGVDAAVGEARAVVDRLLGHRILRRRSSDVSMESALRGARASAVLDGAGADLEQVRAGSSDDPRIKGALRVSGELGLLAETWTKAPRQVLARLHALAAADGADEDALGRPRAAGEPAGDPLGLGPAPRPGEVAARLDALDTVLASRAAVPAPVVGAVVHGELAVLRPFGWGDGVVARAAERLTLIARGLDPKSLVPTELGYLELREEYGPALRGYLAGTPEGVGAWVAFCCRAVAAGARDSLATCEALQRG